MKTRPNFEVTNPSKASAVPTEKQSVFTAVVVRSDSTGVYVKSQGLAPNQVFGPCQCFAQKPKVGRSVICGFLAGQRQTLVILGTENKNFKIVDVATPVEDEDSANKKYVDDKVAELLQKLLAKAPGHVLPYQAPGSYASSAHTH